MPRTNDDPSVRLAIHEGAHAIALMVRGHAPTRVVANVGGGVVGVAPGTPLDVRALAAACGHIAERMLLDADDAEPSFEDAAVITEAATFEDCAPRAYFRWVNKQATDFVFEHEGEIVELANCLLKTPVMYAAELRAACAPMTPLFKHRLLFPAAKASPKPALSQAMMQSRSVAAKPDRHEHREPAPLDNYGFTRRDLTDGGLHPSLAELLASK